MPSRSSFVNNSNSIQTQFNHTYVNQPQATRICYQVVFNFKAQMALCSANSSEGVWTHKSTIIKIYLNVCVAGYTYT